MDDKEYLENPKTFNKKIQWFKLYYRRLEFTQYIDKYEVREYIAKMLGEWINLPKPVVK